MSRNQRNKTQEFNLKFANRKKMQVFIWPNKYYRNKESIEFQEKHVFNTYFLTKTAEFHIVVFFNYYYYYYNYNYYYCKSLGKVYWISSHPLVYTNNRMDTCFPRFGVLSFRHLALKQITQKKNLDFYISFLRSTREIVLQAENNIVVLYSYKLQVAIGHAYNSGLSFFLVEIFKSFKSMCHAVCREWSRLQINTIVKKYLLKPILIYCIYKISLIWVIETSLQTNYIPVSLALCEC